MSLRGRQRDLLGRSCKVSAFFTSPLRLSDATPSLRMTPQCPPGSLVCRLASVVSKSSSRTSRIRRSPRLSLVSPTRIRGSLSTRSFIPSGPLANPRQDPRTIPLFPMRTRRAHRACAGVCLYNNSYLLIAPVVQGGARPVAWIYFPWPMGAPQRLSAAFFLVAPCPGCLYQLRLVRPHKSMQRFNVLPFVMRMRPSRRRF